MKLPKAAVIALLLALTFAALSTRALGQSPAGLAAFRAVCGAERTKVIADWRVEIKARQRGDSAQKAWTPAEEQQRMDVDFKEVSTAPPAMLEQFDDKWPELWRDARGMDSDPDFIQRAELLLAACAISVFRNWEAGVRDIPALTEAWAAARTIYRTGVAPRATATTPGSHPPAPAPSGTTREPGAPTTVDPYAGAPIDCVRPDYEVDYGAFVNVCDFPVSFAYCVNNPKKGAWSEHFKCETNGGRLGVDSIAARGRQAAHIKEGESVHWFACRKPKMPQNARFDGRQIISTCK